MQSANTLIIIFCQINQAVLWLKGEWNARENCSFLVNNYTYLLDFFSGIDYWLHFTRIHDFLKNNYYKLSVCMNNYTITNHDAALARDMIDHPYKIPHQTCCKVGINFFCGHPHLHCTAPSSDLVLYAWHSIHMWASSLVNTYDQKMVLDP
jgi:hypothetical protein